MWSNNGLQTFPEIKSLSDGQLCMLSVSECVCVCLAGAHPASLAVSPPRVPLRRLATGQAIQGMAGSGFEECLIGALLFRAWCWHRLDCGVS